MPPLYAELKSRYYLRKEKGKVYQIPAFLSRISVLLKEGYTISDSIDMLLPFHVDKVAYWRRFVQEQLREGAEVVDILKRFNIPHQYLIILKIAEENGEISLALQNVAAQMEFNQKAKNKFMKLLIYPTLLLIILSSVFIGFRTFFLPNIQHIITSRNDDDSSSINLSMLFLHFPDYFMLISLIVLCSSVTFWLYIKKRDVSERLKLLVKMPIINYFYKLHITRQFSYALGSLLLGGFSLQHALSILKEQELNPTLAYVTSIAEKNVIYGDTLSHTISMMPCFFSKFEDFINHGEKSGYLGRELLIYCELLDEKFQSIIKTSLTVVQPFFFIIIAICLMAAYLSILLPMYELIEII